MNTASSSDKPMAIKITHTIRGCIATTKEGDFMVTLKKGTVIRCQKVISRQLSDMVKIGKDKAYYIPRIRGFHLWRKIQ